MAVAFTQPTERIEDDTHKCDVCESNMVNHVNFHTEEGKEILTLVCNMCGQTTERQI